MLIEVDIIKDYAHISRHILNVRLASHSPTLSLRQRNHGEIEKWDLLKMCAELIISLTSR